MRRHHHGSDAEQVRDVDGVHRSRASVSHQGEIPGVVTPFHADVSDRAHHGIVGNPQHPAGGLRYLQSQGARDGTAYRRVGQVPVQG